MTSDIRKIHEGGAECRIYHTEPTEVDQLVFAKLVPPDHYLRRVKQVIDFERCRDLVTDCYSQAQGHDLAAAAMDGIGWQGEVLRTLREPQGPAVEVYVPPRTEPAAAFLYSACNGAIGLMGDILTMTHHLGAAIFLCLVTVHHSSLIGAAPSSIPTADLPLLAQNRMSLAQALRSPAKPQVPFPAALESIIFVSGVKREAAVRRMGSILIGRIAVSLGYSL